MADDPRTEMGNSLKLSVSVTITISLVCFLHEGHAFALAEKMSEVEQCTFSSVLQLNIFEPESGKQ